MPDMEILKMTTAIVSAKLGITSKVIETDELASDIAAIYSALEKCGEPEAPAEVAPEPAVSIRASVKPDYIVCLEDGKKLKMLKRHLATHYAMTPDEYRARWNLPADYPMVAPNYAEKRRELAKKIGLGRNSTGRTRQRTA